MLVRKDLESGAVGLECVGAYRWMYCGGTASAGVTSMWASPQGTTSTCRVPKSMRCIGRIEQSTRTILGKTVSGTYRYHLSSLPVEHFDQEVVNSALHSAQLPYYTAFPNNECEYGEVPRYIAIRGRKGLHARYHCCGVIPPNGF